jgi:hypothetical protein
VLVPGAVAASAKPDLQAASSAACCANTHNCDVLCNLFGANVLVDGVCQHLEWASGVIVIVATYSVALFQSLHA